MTLSELAIFIEGSDVAARVGLRSNLLKRPDLRPTFPSDDTRGGEISPVSRYAAPCVYCSYC